LPVRRRVAGLEYLAEGSIGAEAHLPRRIDLVEEGGAQHVHFQARIQEGQGLGVGPNMSAIAMARAGVVGAPFPAEKAPVRQPEAGVAPEHRHGAGDRVNHRRRQGALEQRVPEIDGRRLEPREVVGHIARDLPGIGKPGAVADPRRGRHGRRRAKPAIHPVGEIPTDHKRDRRAFAGRQFKRDADRAGDNVHDLRPDHPLRGHLIGIDLGQASVGGKIVPELAERIVPAAPKPFRLRGDFTGHRRDGRVSEGQLRVGDFWSLEEHPMRQIVRPPAIPRWAAGVAPQVVVLVEA